MEQPEIEETIAGIAEAAAGKVISLTKTMNHLIHLIAILVNRQGKRVALSRVEAEATCPHAVEIKEDKTTDTLVITTEKDPCPLKH